MAKTKVVSGSRNQPPLRSMAVMGAMMLSGMAGSSIHQSEPFKAPPAGLTNEKPRKLKRHKIGNHFAFN